MALTHVIDPKKLGQAISNQREKQGLTQDDLSIRSSLSRP